MGETIAEDRFLILHGNDVVADLPLSKLSSSAPEYDRPWVETPAADALPDLPAIAPMDGLRALIASPNYAHKGWVWEQYDSQVMGDTVRTPGLGAGVVRVHGTKQGAGLHQRCHAALRARQPVRGRQNRPWPKPIAI